jgi:hypothetical protein
MSDKRWPDATTQPAMPDPPPSIAPVKTSADSSAIAAPRSAAVNVQRRAEKKAAADDNHENRPTSVPRSDRESIATQDQPFKGDVVLGRVLVSNGIEIKTVRPHFHIATIYTAAPRNPTARLVFDKTGQVIKAVLTRSSGYPDIDSPILNSLYEWRATGKKLQQLKSDTLVLDDLHLLIVDEPDQP